MKWTIKEENRVTCIGHIVDVVKREIIDGEIVIENERVKSINRRNDIPTDAPYYLPGFIDSHVHIESSMVVPAEFARIAVQHGTVAAIADPHEIGNVLGIEGIDFMLRSADLSKFNFFFGAPSCVPSCSKEFETSGAVITSSDIASLMKRDNIWFLGEMMNYPGVLGGDPEVIAKIQATLSAGKPVDGHAPGLFGAEREAYAHAGISTDHECSTLEEGRECQRHGMMVQIREGSAAKNFEMLIPLLGEAVDKVMFCTDDCHPTDLVQGHINLIVRRALSKGYRLFDVLQAACVNPVHHYHLPVGLLQVGDYADFISVTDLTPSFRVRKTYIRGERVYSSNGYYTTIKMQQKSIESQLSMLHAYPNRFLATPLTPVDIARSERPGDNVRCIVATDGSLLTDSATMPLSKLVQKIVVYNRYDASATPQVGYISGFNLTNGAMAASIAHDCHNIVAIGSDDESIVKVINRVIEMRGGIAALCQDELNDLALPIAGLISPLSGHEVAFKNLQLERTVRKAGCTMNSPFITMAFMALPVIPSLKLTDKGLFDSQHFKFVNQ